MYNKLLSQLLDSSIWTKHNDVRIVWITLLATMDKNGFSSLASPKVVAQRAGFSGFYEDAGFQECKRALEELMQPDMDSEHAENDGRRIQKVAGGYLVLNAEKYIGLSNEIAKRDYYRVKQREHRAKKANRVISNQSPNHPTT